MQELEEKRLRKCITVVGQTVTEISVQRTFSRGTAGKGCCWKEALPEREDDKMRRKKEGWGRALVLGAAAGMMWMWGGLTAFAGSWQQDASGWWWQEEDGSYPASEWKWIDGDMDGVAECYYFNDMGYCLTGGTAPDGSQVNESGAWVVDGRVQVSQAGAAAADETGSGVYGELSYEEAKARLLAYYNNLQADDGNYVIMDSESVASDSGYTFTVRYQMSDREAQERISRGGFPAANILVSMDVVDRHIGVARLGNGGSVDLRQQ